MSAGSDLISPPVRLLIVEDHELVAETLAFALRQLGLEVETTNGASGAAVSTAVARFTPGLVLLDLDLAEGPDSGAHLARQLTRAGVAVVIMTGVTEPARLAACIEAGARGIVSKAGGFQELVGAVRRFVSGEALMTEHERQDLLTQLRDHRSADRERLRPFGLLTAREQSVLAGLVAGDPAEVIATKSYVSLTTVRTQIRAILRKLGVKSQLAAVAMARDAQWPGPAGG